MVHITFYHTSADRNVINKRIVSVSSTTAELYDNTNILNPELKLAWDNTYATEANYFYIQEFNRYYFLDDIVAEPGGAARVKGSVDVLYTYKQSIGTDQIIVTRAQYSKAVKSRVSGLFGDNYGPTYFRDSRYPVMPQRDIQVYEFAANPFNLNVAGANSNNFVLNVMGRTPGGE